MSQVSFRLGLLIVSLLVLGCGTAPPSPTASDGQTAVSRGGILRIVVPTVELDNFAYQPPWFLDPVQDSSRGTRELLRCCLGRTLYSYNGRSIEEGGARLQPDLAAALPDVSADGLTWTIRLQHGLHWGPPLEDVEISAADVIRGFHRLLFLSNGSFAPTQVMDIVGAADYAAGSAPTISGLSSPDAHTLVIRLLRPAGDLAAALAAPITTPVPPNPAQPDASFGAAEGTGDCSMYEERPGCGYGSFLVSSGPYMLEGSAGLDFTVPASRRRPVSGITLGGGVTLVRNPSWDHTTDALRPAYVDHIAITTVGSMDAAVTNMDLGWADLLWNPVTPPTVPADVYAAFEADPGRGHTHVDRASVTRYVVMNLALPPFDDVHVRTALNWAIDKQRLVDLQGGPSAAGVIGHLAPDRVEDGLLMDYDPYASAGQRGDLAAARAEMMLSRYDTNRDGRCDVAACRNVKAVTREGFGLAAKAIAEDAALLGIQLEITVPDVNTFFDSVGDPTQKVPVFIGLGYLNPSGDSVLNTFHSGLVGVSPSMVGATPEQLRTWGYDLTAVPNVDARLDACAPLVGAARFSCDASLDQYLMEVVVPMVPFSQDRFTALTSARVTNYAFDELTGTTSIDHIALAP
jgi:peptide/nickel transport system substrate-binding protein